MYKPSQRSKPGHAHTVSGQRVHGHSDEPSLGPKQARAGHAVLGMKRAAAGCQPAVACLRLSVKVQRQPGTSKCRQTPPGGMSTCIQHVQYTVKKGAGSMGRTFDYTGTDPQDAKVAAALLRVGAALGCHRVSESSLSNAARRQQAVPPGWVNWAAVDSITKGSSGPHKKSAQSTLSVSQSV